MNGAPLKIMLIAGEPSGDALGAQLMAGLKELRPEGLTFSGVGGPLMEGEGLKSLFSLADTSVMGLREVVPKIPAILRRVKEAADHAIETRPDVVVLIDSPDFTHRIGRRLKRLAPGTTIVKYVAPQVWASRPWRAKSLAEFVDYLFALLPFEPAFFEGYGLKTMFVGHPVIERSPQIAPEEVSAFRERFGIGAEDTVLALLPGSRANEVRFLMPVFSEVVEKLAPDYPRLICLVPTLAHVKEKVEAAVKGLKARVILLEGERDKFTAFKTSVAALAASGTVSTELAIAGTPMVIAYRVGWLTALLSRPFFKPKFITLINLILDRRVIPEYWQETCKAETLLAALRGLMASEEARRLQMREARRALTILGVGAERPSRRAARALLDVVALGNYPKPLPPP